MCLMHRSLAGQRGAQRLEPGGGAAAHGQGVQEQVAGVVDQQPGTAEGAAEDG